LSTGLEGGSTKAKAMKQSGFERACKKGTMEASFPLEKNRK